MGPDPSLWVTDRYFKQTGGQVDPADESGDVLR